MKNAPLEIERKYLVKIPNMETVRAQEGYKVAEMTQMYLDDGGKYAGIRIRKSLCQGETSCKKTIKKDITPLKRIEVESDITPQEYEALSKHCDSEYKPIHKWRHSFSYKNQTIELDIYDFWNDRATVEVEMESEEQKVELPDFIEVIKEVTEDCRYRNRSLAKEVIYEEV